jgi:hypothetical protein
LIDRAIAFYASEESKETFSVMIFGGSVAAIFAGVGQGVREELKQDLKALPELQGKPVKVMCFAVAGYRQPQQLEFLAYLLVRGCRPTVVVNLDGLNEVRKPTTNVKRDVLPHVAIDRTLGTARDTQF